MAALVSETQGVTVLFVSARMDAKLVRGITAAAGMFGGLAGHAARSDICISTHPHIYCPKDETRTAKPLNCANAS